MDAQADARHSDPPPGKPLFAPIRDLPCPHCGYDLTGLVKSWSDSPPERATCSECGRTIESALLTPERSEPRWSFEHGSEGRVRRFFATWMRLLWPSIFWRGLPPRVRLRPIRLMIFVLICVATCYAWIGSMAGRNTYWSLNTMSPWSRASTTPPPAAEQVRTIAEAVLWPDENFRAFWTLLHTWGALAFFGTLLIPLAFLPLLPLLLRSPGACASLARATLYQLPLVTLVWTLLSWRAWCGPFGGWTTDSLYAGLPHSSAFILGTYTLWAASYWLNFTKSHTRVPHPTLAWAFVIFVSFGTATFLLLKAEFPLPRMEIGMLLVDLLGPPPPSP